jgi:hypothetical protein
MRIAGYPAAAPPCCAERSSAPARARSMEMTRAMSAELTITTDEGDKVTLSFDAAFSASRTQEPGYRASSVQAGVRAEVKVEGELNAEEIADIQKLMGMLGRAMRKPEKAPQIAQKIARLDSLATVDFTAATVAERTITPMRA